MLPVPVGVFSDANANGLVVIRKDLPKETVYYSQNRTITDWHGYEHDVVVNMPYHKFPRQNNVGKQIKVMVSEGKIKDEGAILTFVFDKEIQKGTNDWERDLVFLVNLSLELFGGFDIIDGDSSVSLLKTLHANWKILPPDEYPFEKIKSLLIEQITKSQVDPRHFDLGRLEFMESLQPDFRAIGIDQFMGYVVFGFKKTGHYILDNVKIGNAVYVFSGNWENLFKKTKKELISDKSGKIKRIVHRGGWKQAVANL